MRRATAPDHPGPPTIAARQRGVNTRRGSRRARDRPCVMPGGSSAAEPRRGRRTDSAGRCRRCGRARRTQGRRPVASGRRGAKSEDREQREHAGDGATDRQPRRRPVDRDARTGGRVDDEHVARAQLAAGELRLDAVDAGREVGRESDVGREVARSIDDERADGEAVLEVADREADLAPPLEVLAADPDATARGDRRRLEDEARIAFVGADDRGPGEAGEEEQREERRTPARPMGELASKGRDRARRSDGRRCRSGRRASA
jgi:hypothetical protein